MRIFSPGQEFPFAGHPTLATAFAVLKKGDLFPDGCVPEVLCQECGIGIVPVRITGKATEAQMFTMTQGRPQYRESRISRGLMAELLGCPEEALASGSFEVVSTGLPWLIAEIANQPILSALKPNQGRIAEVCAGLGTPGITAFCENPASSTARIRLRTFAPVVGVAEDPVCGSGNGCVAAWLARHRHANKNSFVYAAEQGVEIGRHGRVHVTGTRAEDTWSIEVGGAAVSVLFGSITLP